MIALEILKDLRRSSMTKYEYPTIRATAEVSKFKHTYNYQKLLLNTGIFILHDGFIILSSYMLVVRLECLYSVPCANERACCGRGKPVL